MTSSKSILLLAFFAFVGAEIESVQSEVFIAHKVFIMKRKSTYKSKMQALPIFSFNVYKLRYATL